MEEGAQPPGLKGRFFSRIRSVFEDPNLVGAGIAEKLVEGQPAGELALVFYVRRKAPLDELSPTAWIPPLVLGGDGRAVHTDVVEVGDIQPQLNVTPPPLRCGYSCGHAEGQAGSLGALVQRDGATHILSNSHVLARAGLAQLGDPVVFPGPQDGGRAPGDVVARLSAVVPWRIDSAFVNIADAALAEVVPAYLASAQAVIPGARLPLRVAAPRRGMQVGKRGRTSGDTEAVVLDVDFRLRMPYAGVGEIGFKGQVRCGRYTQDGDSGAVVVDLDSGAIVGLHFAGSGTASVFTPMATVMEALGFTF